MKEGTIITEKQLKMINDNLIVKVGYTSEDIEKAFDWLHENNFIDKNGVLTEKCFI